MSLLIALVIAWIGLRLLTAPARPRRTFGPARELYERRLREGPRG